MAPAAAIAPAPYAGRIDPARYDRAPTLTAGDAVRIATGAEVDVAL